MHAKSNWFVAILIVAIVVVLIAVFMGRPAAAQALAQPADRPPVVLLPTTLTGLGSMGPRGARRFCNARSVGLMEWRTQVVVRKLALNADQQAALSALSAASTKGLDTLASACSQRATSQLATIQARLEAVLVVVQTVRPAYDAFYASLDNVQKLRLDALGPGRGGWQW